MQDTSKKGRVAQYKWIKDYIKSNEISERSLFRIYANVLYLENYKGVDYSEKLSSSERKLALAIRKMVSYTSVIVEKNN